MYNITLLRHAESEGNVDQRLQGHFDSPLTQRGLRQAEALGNRWRAENRRFDLILSSPLVRAKQTAEIIQKAISAPIELDQIWQERNMGGAENMEYEALSRLVSNPSSRSPYHDAFGLGGEGQWKLYLRASNALHFLLNKPEGSYLVICHGGLLNALMYSILGMAPGAFGTGPSF
ncbi:MAG: histidine phosphatase family protein, partial [Anaerolineales bacterium]